MNAENVSFTKHVRILLEILIRTLRTINKKINQFPKFLEKKIYVLPFQRDIAIV